MSSIICSASFLFTQRSKVESWLRLYRVPLLRKNLAANLLRNFMSFNGRPFRVLLSFEISFYFMEPWFFFRSFGIDLIAIGWFILSVNGDYWRLVVPPDFEHG